jgi:hypothetical protein
VVKLLALPIHIWKILGSDVGPETHHTEVCGFPPFHQANASVAPHIIKALKKTTAVIYTSVAD